MVASKRSQERRKDLESKKDNKKLTAMQELKARREEKKYRGIYLPWIFQLICSLISNIVFIKKGINFYNLFLK